MNAHRAATRCPPGAHAGRFSITLRRSLAIAGAALIAAASVAAQAAGPLPGCVGESVPLVVDHQMPYAQVRVAGRAGWFALDFGATTSSITPAGFVDGPPQPLPGSADRYDGFEFFGPWGTVQLNLQPQAPVTSTVKQAGIVGTDFLASHVYTLDYRGARLYRSARQTFCSDASLLAAGLRPVSTRDYYGTSPQALSCPMAGGPPRCVNIPTVPVRIGAVQAVAQLDTGYDDGSRPYSININAALFEALQRARVRLRPRPDIALRLSTCVADLSETVEAWQLDRGEVFGLLDERGARLPPPPTAVTLFVKRTPAAAAGCGGIGTWAQPAAQLGASFVARGTLVVDPFSQRVWLRP